MHEAEKIEPTKEQKQVATEIAASVIVNGQRGMDTVELIAFAINRMAYVLAEREERLRGEHASFFHKELDGWTDVNESLRAQVRALKKERDDMDVRAGTYSMHLDEARREVERLRKLFDDAGQGEYDVLALVDHYQKEALDADRLRARVSELEGSRIVDDVVASSK